MGMAINLEHARMIKRTIEIRYLTLGGFVVLFDETDWGAQSLDSAATICATQRQVLREVERIMKRVRRKI
jgi:hypothetical protein